MGTDKQTDLNGLNTCRWLWVSETLLACTVSSVSVVRSTKIRARERYRHIHLGQPDKLAAYADPVKNTTSSYRHQNPLHQTHYTTRSSKQQLRSSYILTERVTYFEQVTYTSHSLSKTATDASQLTLHRPYSLTVQTFQPLHLIPQLCIPLSSPLACRPLGSLSTYTYTTCPNFLHDYYSWNDASWVWEHNDPLKCWGGGQHCMPEYLNLRDRCCQNLESQTNIYYHLTNILFHLYKRGMYANGRHGIRTEHTKLNVIHFWLLFLL